MKLTKKQAIDWSIELWEFLAETGSAYKHLWPKWEELGKAKNDCFLCEYSFPKGGSILDGSECDKCPLEWGLYGCEDNEESAYFKWLDWATNKKERKEYAKLFLKQLKELK